MQKFGLWIWVIVFITSLSVQAQDPVSKYPVQFIEYGVWTDTLEYQRVHAVRNAVTILGQYVSFPISYMASDTCSESLVRDILGEDAFALSLTVGDGGLYANDVLLDLHRQGIYGGQHDGDLLEIIQQSDKHFRGSITRTFMDCTVTRYYGFVAEDTIQVIEDDDLIRFLIRLLTAFEIDIIETDDTLIQFGTCQNALAIQFISGDLLLTSLPQKTMATLVGLENTYVPLPIPSNDPTHFDQLFVEVDKNDLTWILGECVFESDLLQLPLKSYVVNEAVQTSDDAPFCFVVLGISSTRASIFPDSPIQEKMLGVRRVMPSVDMSMKAIQDVTAGFCNP